MVGCRPATEAFGHSSMPGRSEGARMTRRGDRRREHGRVAARRPAGHRQFFTFATDRRFALDSGAAAGRRHGRLRDVGHARRHGAATPCCSATPGPATATSPARPGAGHPAPGWWEGMVGPGRPIDTDRWFVVCANVLGGCQGSTGPASPHPVDGRPYGVALPGDHDPRHGAGPGPPRRPPRRRHAGTP